MFDKISSSFLFAFAQPRSHIPDYSSSSPKESDIHGFIRSGITCRWCEATNVRFFRLNQPIIIAFTIFYLASSSLSWLATSSTAIMSSILMSLCPYSISHSMELDHPSETMSSFSQPKVISAMGCKRSSPLEIDNGQSPHGCHRVKSLTKPDHNQALL
jgi:hypothetical protein